MTDRYTKAIEQLGSDKLDVRIGGIYALERIALDSDKDHLPLAAGEIVLCDRFTDSSEAYQGGGRKLGSAPVHDLHRTLVGNLQPDLTILMDSDVAASLDRARRRNQAHSKTHDSDENRFERENRAFFTRVHTAYMDIAKREPARVALVDARGTPDQTHAKIVEIVRRKLHLLASGARS